MFTWFLVIYLDVYKRQPVSQKMYFDGKMAMGISLSPEGGANVVEVGKVIDKKIIEPFLTGSGMAFIT